VVVSEFLEGATPEVWVSDRLGAPISSSVSKFLLSLASPPVR